MMLQLIAISLLDLSVLRVIPQRQVIHYAAYLKCSTGVIKINDVNIHHYSDSILESKQFMSTTHNLLYISTSCLGSENEVLQDYVLLLPFQRHVQGSILGYSEPTSIFFSSAIQSIFALVESLMMKLLMALLLSWRYLSQISTVY